MRSLTTLIICWFLLSCSDGKQPLKGETSWQRDMNAMFKDASVSPLTEKDRKAFTGLAFFTFDSSYIVKARLKRTPGSEFFDMKTTTGDVSRERIFGVLHFELKGNSYKLNIYQGEDALETINNRDYLFLPFLDDTNAETTYGGGRYLDLRIPAGDSLTIDFNKAYQPYCAYNERYSCPLVPRENYLAVKIKAGVRMPD
ncbi:MAG: DUF1684 domain-containing protein [Bacteroidia bacterium]|nr:DUF1684 domain-containing protein [Bacteroidia bacterium]